MNFSESARQQLNTHLARAVDGEKTFREKAWADFERLGWPDRKNEAWKYTSLAGLERQAFAPAPAPSGVLPYNVRTLMSAYKGDFDVLVLVNGQPQMQLAHLTLEAGYELTHFAPDENVRLQGEDGLTAMAAALYRGGIHLRVADGIEFPRPLLMVHCQQGEGGWTPSCHRIHLGRGAKFQLAEIFIGEGTPYLRTDLNEVTLEEGAELSWVRVQEEGAAASHLNEVQMQVRARAKVFLTQANCGASWARGLLKVDILGEQAEAHINGLTFGREQQHSDQRVRINHLAAHGTSSQLFKGILKDRARGVLNGKIYIARDAQKVTSSQYNHNLILSPGAEADTKPELEIYADDVKANHGASIGRMDGERLFYLLSRGIPPHEAERMLAQAFAADVLMKVPTPLLRDLLRERVAQMLPEFTGGVETL